MLKIGGILILDDIQLFSVKSLYSLLAEQPGWNLIFTSTNHKMCAFEKTTDEQFLPHFYDQPFILNNAK